MTGTNRSLPLTLFFVGIERRHVINTTATLASRGIPKDRFDLASIHQLSNLLGCSGCDPLNETPLVDNVLGVLRVQNNRHNKNTVRAAMVPVVAVKSKMMFAHLVRHSALGGTHSKARTWAPSIEPLHCCTLLQCATTKLNNATHCVYCKEQLPNSDICKFQTRCAVGKRMQRVRFPRGTAGTSLTAS